MPDRSPEEVRNERLRLIDWRFLLSSPRPRRVLCFGGGSVAEAMEMIGGQVVESTAGGDCDLATADSPNAATPRELWTALVPGGACFTEWRSELGEAGAIEARLRAAGFQDVACYRRWPRAARLPVYWIPVGSPAAEAYVR